MYNIIPVLVDLYGWVSEFTRSMACLSPLGTMEGNWIYTLTTINRKRIQNTKVNIYCSTEYRVLRTSMLSASMSLRLGFPKSQDYTSCTGHLLRRSRRRVFEFGEAQAHYFQQELRIKQAALT